MTKEPVKIGATHVRPPQLHGKGLSYRTSPSATEIEYELEDPVEDTIGLSSARPPAEDYTKMIMSSAPEARMRLRSTYSGRCLEKYGFR